MMLRKRTLFDRICRFPRLIVKHHRMFDAKASSWCVRARAALEMALLCFRTSRVKRR